METWRRYDTLEKEPNDITKLKKKIDVAYEAKRSILQHIKSKSLIQKKINQHRKKHKGQKGRSF